MTTKKQLAHGRFPLVFGFIVLMLTLHWQAVYADMHQPGSVLAGWSWLFDLDREHNIPTTLSSLLFLAASYWSILLAIKAKISIQKMGWALFGIFFGYLALDEFLIIHEQLAEPLRGILNISNNSPVFHAWVLPALAIAIFLIAGLFIIRAHWHNLKVFFDVLLLVLVLVVGTVGCEIAGTYIYANREAYRFVMVPTEELFELTMAALIWLKLTSTHKAKHKK